MTALEKSRVGLLPAPLEELFDGLVETRLEEVLGASSDDGGWPSRLLGEVATVANPCPRTPDGDVWLLRPGAIRQGSGEVLSKDIAPPSEVMPGSRSFSELHVVYSVQDPGLRRAAAPDGPGICSRGLVPLLPDQDVLDRDFLACFLRSAPVTERLAALASAHVLPMLPIDDLLGIDVPLPPIGIQRGLSAFAASVERARALARREVALFDELVESRFAESFDLGACDRWAPISDLVLFAEDMVGPGPSDGGVHDGPIAEEGDVVVSRRGTQGSYATARCVGGPGVAWVPSGPALRLRLGGSVDPAYLAHLLNSEAYRQKLGALARQSPLSTEMRKEALLDVEVPVFPIVDQREFASFAARVGRSKDSFIAGLSSLMQSRR